MGERTNRRKTLSATNVVTVKYKAVQNGGR